MTTGATVRFDGGYGRGRISNAPAQMSGDFVQLVWGVLLVGAGVYVITWHPGAQVFGWIAAFLGAWTVISLHPWVRDGLLDIDTWMGEDPPS